MKYVHLDSVESGQYLGRTILCQQWGDFAFGEACS